MWRYIIRNGWDQRNGQTERGSRPPVPTRMTTTLKQRPEHRSNSLTVSGHTCATRRPDCNLLASGKWQSKSTGNNQTNSHRLTQFSIGYKVFHFVCEAVINIIEMFFYYFSLIMKCNANCLIWVRTGFRLNKGTVRQQFVLTGEEREGERDREGEGEGKSITAFKIDK